MKKRLVESSLGIRTTEATARRIDVLLKELPSAQREIRRKAVTAADAEIGERTDISRITTASVDKDFEIVVPGGIDLTDYRKNPIVLYGHDQNKPVGKCLWVKADESGLIAKTQYASRPAKYQGEWLPDYVWEMIRADVLRGKSIGFLPLEIRDPTNKEVSQFPSVQRVISRCQLFEYSVVGVPANGEALVESIGKGLGHLWGMKVLGKIKPKATPKPVPTKPKSLTVDDIAEAAYRHLASRWEV